MSTALAGILSTRLTFLEELLPPHRVAHTRVHFRVLPNELGAKLNLPLPAETDASLVLGVLRMFMFDESDRLIGGALLSVFRRGLPGSCANRLTHPARIARARQVALRAED